MRMAPEVAMFSSYPDSFDNEREPGTSRDAG
jgi:hypothetical protein